MSEEQHTHQVKLKPEQRELLDFLNVAVREAQAEVQKAQQRLSIAVRMVARENGLDETWELRNLDEGFVQPHEHEKAAS